MKKISIVNRETSPEEQKQMNIGFDQLSIEEGVELESSVKYSCVALEGDTFVGCASGLAFKNGENYSGWFYLKDLYVEKELRSQGIGSRLLRSLEEKVKVIGVKHIWLWTSGPKTLKFYDRQGYKEFAAMENWYSDGSSRVGLRKDL